MNLPAGERLEFVVADERTGTRLDVFLSRQDDLLTRSRIKRIIEEGLVWLNGKSTKPGTRLKGGDIVVVAKAEPRECSVVPEDIPLTVVYEDDSILLVDKPAGMVVHPAAGNYSGTLVNALLFHCAGLSGIGGVKRPGIVHRLDKYTSGIMVVAKSDMAHIGLSSQFEERKVKKVYRALVHGDVKGDEGIIELPIGRHVKDRKKMSTRSRRGKLALTRWKVTERFGAATLLEVRIETGRTHQIRVHLNTEGYPVVGDDIYGSSKKRVNSIKDNLSREVLKKMKRQALHAASIGLYHPVTGSYVEFFSPLPADMAGLCTELERLKNQVLSS
ncbi:MAG: RluA family pseudouridine synthase [Syntrophaceae bacterium]|nr:RluA family pseudouridine synthase [Syntrophaceae bacterium]